MKYDAQIVEEEIIEYWNKNLIYKKSKEKNKNKQKYYFLDGPPYTSGKIHLGQAWNKSMKDMVLRYKRMQGFDVWDRAGYDMHGLPTAHKVEAKFGIKSKDEIPKFGVDKFINECEKLALANMEQMNVDFDRLGIWMDFKNAYKPISKEFIEGEWWLIKKAHEKKRLYEGKKTMHWCASCATALAKHELEYKEITDTSIFVKLQVKDKPKEFLIIWTTTPWTIPFNLAVMVNPNLEYVKAKVEDETWIVSKALVAPVVQAVAGKTYVELESFTGDKLEGLEYIHPFNDQITDYKELKEKHPKLHTVVLSAEHVDTSAGSGLVHCAPGCGPEDYEVGYKNNLPAYNNVDEYGMFVAHMGEFAGKLAKKDDKYFIEALEKRGALIETTKVEHDYAHCWRCHEPVIFRTTPQWFFKIEDLKDKMRKLNKEVHWVPDWAGSRQFDSWLANLRDNSITRQRYWGCPVPIWKCEDCGSYDVIDSVEEIKAKCGKAPKKLHRPWIDEIEWKCECGAMKKRVPDILDVWIDAGTNSWTCLDYPSKKELFEELFPADFILEGKDQIRGWFNLLFISSMIGMDKPSYKAVYMHGFIQDSNGQKMSKSLGNIVSPYEVIDRHGADTLRYYMIGNGKAGVDINYNLDDMSVKSRQLVLLWNIHNYLISFAKELDINPSQIDDSVLDNARIEEKYILSKLNSAIHKVTLLYNEYRLDEIPEVIENLFLELSRTYIQLIRDKAAIGSDEDKEVVLYTIYKVMTETIKMFSTIAPFISEKMYLNLKNVFNLPTESIHLFDWPKSDGNLIDEDLEKDIEITKIVIQSTLAAREKAQLGLRWPLKEITIVTQKDFVNKAVRNTYEIIKQQTNCKEVLLETEIEGVKELVQPDNSKLSPEFKQKSPEVIAKLAKVSPEVLIKAVRENGKYELQLDNEKVNILLKHLIIERETPDHLEGNTFRHGEVFINTERTPVLDAEGFARELTRRVQNCRKIASLEKLDRINLALVVPEDLKVHLNLMGALIQEKCGADNLDILTKEASGYHTKTEEKIKGKQFTILFTKI